MTARWATPLVGLGALAWFASLVPWGSLHRDEGWLLESAWRVLHGELPHRDFASIYPMGRYLLVAGAMKLTGTTLLAVRGVEAGLRALTSALVFSTGRRWMPPPLALAAAVTATLLPGPWHKTLYALVPLVVLRAWQRWLDAPTPARARAVGLAAGIGAWFRQDTALLAAAAVIGVALVRARLTPERRAVELGLVHHVLTWSLAVTLGGLALLAPWVSPVDVVRQLLFDAVADGRPDVGTLGDLLVGEPDRYALRGLMLMTGVAIAAALLAGSGVVQGLRGLRAGPAPDRAAQLLAVSLLAALTANQVLRPNALTRFLQDGPPFFLLWWAGASPALAAWGRPGARRIGGALGLLAALAGPAWLAEGIRPIRGNTPVTPEFSGSYTMRWRDAPLTIDGVVFHLDEDDARELVEVQRLLAEHVPPDAGVVLVPGPSAAYVLSGRRNPTRYVRWVPDAPARRAHVEALLAAGAVDHLVLYGPFVTRQGAAWDELARSCCRAVASRARYEVWRVVP